MIRKAIIVVLTLAATASGAIGVLSGSGCTSWSQILWSSGEFATTGYRCTSLSWGISRLVMVNRLECLDAYAVPNQKRYSGFGWLYDGSVTLIEASGLYSQSSILIVSFYIPILLALVFSSYPTIAFIRGPLRRYQRRKRGLCLKCGYNLTGNVTGVCSECGSQV